ncbi:MAG: hypothetical protein IKL72_03595 [Firmicutes bacterium]|nr:hypothetical protein [Bacillota bacterium]
MREIIINEMERYRKILQEDMEEVKLLSTDGITTKVIKNELYFYKREYDPKTNKRKYRCLGNVKSLDEAYICEILRRDHLNERIKVNKKNLELLTKIVPLLKKEGYGKIYSRVSKAAKFSYATKQDHSIERYKGREVEALIWLSKNNDTVTFRNDELLHMTARGLRVRSKSELLIASALEERRLLFKYEPEIKGGSNSVFRPDFVVLRPGDMKEIYWEHFGLMNDPEYEKKAMEKLIKYQKMGYCLWDNLIISFDSDKGSFNMQSINRIIDMFISVE